MIDRPDELDAEALATLERSLADRVRDKTVSEARAEALKAAAGASEAERRIFAAAADVFGDMQGGGGSHHVLIGGVANLADEAAHWRRETVRRLFEALEHESEMLELLRDVTDRGPHRHDRCRTPAHGRLGGVDRLGSVPGGIHRARGGRRGGADGDGLRRRDGVGPRRRATPVRARHRARRLTHDGHRPRPLRDPRRRARRLDRGHPDGLPAPGPRVPPRRERRSRGRAALQGGRRRLRDPFGRRQAGALRRVRPRRADGDAVRRHHRPVRGVLRDRDVRPPPRRPTEPFAARRGPVRRSRARVQGGGVRRSARGRDRTDGDVRPVHGSGAAAGHDPAAVPHLRRVPGRCRTSAGASSGPS